MFVERVIQEILERQTAKAPPAQQTLTIWLSHGGWLGKLPIEGGTRQYLTRSSIWLTWSSSETVVQQPRDRAAAYGPAAILSDRERRDEGGSECEDALSGTTLTQV
jgi:hypothetical protein